MGDWKDILLDNEEPLSEEDLLKYLDEHTSEDEPEIVKDSFESDAIEGLKQIESTDKVKKHVQHLNKKLHQQLLAKKTSGEKMRSFELRWALFTLLLILFICIISYVLIKLSSV
jgi:hypothetical protein